jgi:hypothetical protein
LGRFLAVVLAFAAGSAAAQSLESAVMPGRVIEGHAKLEGDCAKCHVRFERAAQTRLCLDCHKEVAADVRSGSGFHGTKPGEACRSCHTEHKGRDARIAAFDTKAFDHRATDFALRGAHARVQCASCHAAGRKFRLAPQACVACHRKDDKHRGALGNACADCHGETTWKEVRFDHSRTAFPLRERHVDVPCKDCHADARFKGAPKTCNACHAKDDTHKGRFGTRCESCHGERAWKPAAFDHARDAHYALRGRHAAVRCESCHRAPLHTARLPQACVACHRADDTHKGTLGVRCASCHDETGWKKTSFRHDVDTKFPLRGRHARARCADCHKDPAGRDQPPRECYGCHRADDEAKGHRGRYGEKCAGCHAEQAWKPARFDHARDARYPLRGKHAAVRCDSCHRGVLYGDKLETRCASCHGGTADPHRGQLGPRCESCHGEQAWKPARFEHNASRFPLLGRHASVQCAACHATARYRDASTECVACHEKKDVHKRRLGTRCETCHNARDWRAWDFDHSKTRYRLDGAHRRADCLACHRAPVSGPVRLDTACSSCHARDDVHAGRFGLRCESCHATRSFREVKPSTRR